MVFYLKCDIKNNFLKIFYPSLIEKRGGGLLPTLPPSDEPSFQESLHMQPIGLNLASLSLPKYQNVTDAADVSV